MEERRQADHGTVNALQQQSIATIEASLKALAEQVAAGFKGSHERQDVANGRTSKLETQIELLKQRMDLDAKTALERGTNRVRTWQVISFLLAVIVALASNILYR